MDEKFVKMLSVVGARPQFIKVKPFDLAVADSGSQHVIVHTGQHYDEKMSEVFFQTLKIPTADFNLQVGSGSHGQQTAEMLSKIEMVILEQKPDWVIVFGDTNTTLAAAIASAKLNVPLAHVEAGLRSGNRNMPEEINRILTDHASSILFAPTKLANENLREEGLAEKTFLVGDVMADMIRIIGEDTQISAEGRGSNEFGSSYVVATIHRPSNTDDPDRLREIVEALSSLELNVVLVAHPRLVRCAQDQAITLGSRNVEVIEPLDYLSIIQLLRGSRGIVTDSGGLQKEAFLLGVPCITLRTETEWPETISGGMNVVNPDLTQLSALIERPTTLNTDLPFGDGHAAERIVSILHSHQLGHTPGLGKAS